MFYLITRERAIEGAHNFPQPIAVGSSVLVSKLKYLDPETKTILEFGESEEIKKQGSLICCSNQSFTLIALATKRLA